MSLVLAPFGVEASSVDIDIVASFEDRVYEIGEEVHIVIETFKEGQLFEPRDVGFSGGFGYPHDNPQPEEVDTGRYIVNYTIKETKLTSWGSSAFQVKFMEDGQHASEQYFVRTPLTDTFQVRVFVPDPEDDRPSPGQVVEFEIRPTHRGEPVNLDFGYPRVLAGLHGYGGIDLDRATDVTTSRTDTGVYKGSYRIPTSVNTSTRYDIKIDTQCTIGDWVAIKNIYHSLFLNFLSVWVNVAEVTDATTTVHVIASDLEGAPTQGAGVNFALIRWPMHGFYPPTPFTIYEENQTLDELGRATFALNRTLFEGEPGSSPFIITVRHDNYNQVSEGTLVLSEWELGGGWTPIYGYANLTTELPLPPGESIVLEYEGMIKNGSFPLEGLHAFISDDHAIYWNGPVEVDVSGHFSIPITTPDNGEDGVPYAILNVRFHGRWSATDYWYEWKDTMVVYGLGPLTYWDRHMDPDLELTVDHEEDNRTYHLQLSVPDGDGAQEKVSILWGLGYPYSMSDQPVWFKMTPRPSNVHLGEWSYDRTLEYAGEYIWATFIAPFVWENGIYTTEVRLPDALPTGLEIYFMAVVEPYDDIEPRVALTNLTLDDSTDWHPDVPDDGSDGPEEPGVDDEGSSSLPFISVVEDEPAIILVLIVLIVAIVVIVVLVPGRIRSTRRN